MHLSRLCIRNLRNFSNLDVQLGKHVVIIGENRVGKSNLVYALRLVLDPTLPDSARQLKLSDIWDGVALSDGPTVEVHVDFADFDSDPNLVALLTDYRTASDHTVARLSYMYRVKTGLGRSPVSEADYEFAVYGGGDETRNLRGELRRRICLDTLHALRDAEGDLSSWRLSPLRPLLDDAIGRVSVDAIEEIAQDMDATTKRMGDLEPIRDLDTDLRDKIANLAGANQDLHTRLGFASSDPSRLLRSLGLYIDDGKRGISDASLGSANLALLTIKLAEFEWRRKKNERNYTIVCIEEPEAHLHPHVQRSLFQKLFADTDELHGMILTTHSPNIASVAPLASIVLLRSNAVSGSRAHSLANLGLARTELEDIRRYLDTTRADVLFSRGVIFVEGIAEATLMPAFAASCRYDLDDMGIAVCSVGGTNFVPYVRLAVTLGLPSVVVTDWDPLDGSGTPLGRTRTIDLVTKTGGPISPTSRIEVPLHSPEVTDQDFRRIGIEFGVFLNNHTFEVEIAQTPELRLALLSILEAENFGNTRKMRIEGWKQDASTLDAAQLLAMVADIGKGRLAARLADRAQGLTPPAYIKSALDAIVNEVRHG